MLSVHGSDQLRAAALGLKLARREIRNDINRATRATMNPVWRELVTSRARTQRDRKVLAAGARVAPGNPPSLVAASSTRKLRGGLVPAESWHAVEFGANREAVTTYDRRSPAGKAHTVSRHTRRQLPPRIRNGRVVFPAAEEIGPRLAALWVSLIVRKFNEAVEKGER